MNERIKEIAVQLRPIATIGNWGRVEWADNVYPQLGDRMYADIDLEKFAELIVRECVEVCKSRAGNSDYNTGRMHCASDIKDHFGVE